MGKKSEVRDSSYPLADSPKPTPNYRPAEFQYNSKKADEKKNYRPADSQYNSKKASEASSKIMTDKNKDKYKAQEWMKKQNNTPQR